MSRPTSLRGAAPGLKQTLRLVWPYTRQHKGLLTGSFAAMFASVGLRVLEPWPLKIIFDRVLMPAQGVEPIAGLSTTSVLLIAGFAVVLITTSRAWMGYLNRVGFALVGNRVLTDVRSALYKHLQRLSLAFHSRTRAGDLVVRVISDIGMLQDVVVTAMMPLMGSMLVLVVMAALLLTINLQLAFLVLATLPLFAFPTKRLTKRIQESSRGQRQREGAMASTASESIHAIRVVQTLGLEDQFNQTFGGANKKSLKEGVRTKRLTARLEATVQGLTGLSTAMVLGYGALLVVRGALTPGDLLVFLSYLKAMFGPMQDFAKYTGRMAKASAAGERIVSLFNQQPEITDRIDAYPAPRLNGYVRFEKVMFGYQKDQPILKNISFMVQAGQRVALVGPSGHGKSTLLNLILRLYDVTEGSVVVDGHDVRDITLDSLRSQIAVVLQDNLLFAASIRDNIAFGAPEVSDDEIEAAARLANAHDFISAMPDGYDTIVGEQGSTLSSGQRQRLAIARAAVRQAPILLLDEPTNGLDEENERAVVEAIDRLAQGKTTFLVTHQLRHAARFDAVIYLENGRVIEAGSHQELLRRNGTYARLYRLEESGFPASILQSA